MGEDSVAVYEFLHGTLAAVVEHSALPCGNQFAHKLLELVGIKFVQLYEIHERVDRHENVVVL